MRSRSRILVAVLVAVLVPGATACGGGGPGGLKVVASFYPLAWVAQQVGGNRVAVEDLTPPGVEAHDTTLTAGQRADLQTAKVVVILGRFGFQPDVERAAADARGRVVDATAGLRLQPSVGQSLPFDPHVWLDPILMEQIAHEVADALVAVDPAGRDGYRRRGSATVGELASLESAFRSGLASCSFSTFIATHEAFGYLAAEYGLHELSLEGLTPESEPSASRIQAAMEAVRSGTAAPAVFYEATDEGRRVGQAVAGDIGVPALPLGTLESDPSPQTYVSVMRANLANLERGLRCR